MTWEAGLNHLVLLSLWRNIYTRHSSHLLAVKNNTRSPCWRLFIIFIAQCILPLRGGGGCGVLTVNAFESMPFRAIGVFERVKALLSESVFCQPGKKQFGAGIKIPHLWRYYMGDYTGRKQLGRKEVLILIENTLESGEEGGRTLLQMKNTVYFHGNFLCLVVFFFFFPLPPPIYHTSKSAKQNWFFVQKHESVLLQLVENLGALT